EQIIESTYDAAGERVGLTTSLGHTEVVTRGALGERVRTVLDGDHAVEHRADLLGREIARALPDGGWIQSTYDAMGRVSRRRAGERSCSGTTRRATCTRVARRRRRGSTPRGTGSCAGETRSIAGMTTAGSTRDERAIGRAGGR